jgi:hypothetical protein
LMTRMTIKRRIFWPQMCTIDSPEPYVEMVHSKVVHLMGSTITRDITVIIWPSVQVPIFFFDALKDHDNSKENLSENIKIMNTCSDYYSIRSSAAVRGLLLWTERVGFRVGYSK